MLQEMLQQISPLDSAAMEAARQHWDAIAKPLHSLGRLEDLVVQLAGITGTANLPPRKKAVLIFCADNGVVAEGVTQTTQAVTAAVTRNFTKGITSVNALSRVCGANVFPVDIGVAEELHCDGIISRKIAAGTRNFAHEPAMTREQAERAILTGMALVGEKVAAGYNLIITGEMGIGNTTTSSAVFSVLQQLPPEQVTGRGAGLSGAGLRHKVEVIEKAIALHQPDRNDVLQGRRAGHLRHGWGISWRCSLPCAGADRRLYFRGGGELCCAAGFSLPAVSVRLSLFQRACRKAGTGGTGAACLSGLRHVSGRGHRRRDRCQTVRLRTGSIRRDRRLRCRGNRSL